MPWTVGPPDLRPKLDRLAIPDNNKELDANRIRHGLMPKLSGNPAEALLGDGSFGTPASVSTVADNLFTLFDDGDPTKQARFQLSGLTTGTTRTYTLQDADMILAGTNFANSFTKQQTIRADTAIPSLIVQRSAAGATRIVEVRNTAGTAISIFDTAGRFSISPSGTHATTGTGLINITNNSSTVPGINSTFSLTGLSGQSNTSGLWRLEPTMTGDLVNGIADMTGVSFNGSFTNVTGNFFGMQSNLTMGDIISGNNPNARSMSFTVTTTHASPETYTLVSGCVGSVVHSGAGLITDLEGLGAAFILSNGSGLVTNVKCVWPSVSSVGTGAATNIYGTFFECSATSTNVAGSYVSIVAGTYTNSRGLHIATMTGATNAWPIYSEPDLPSYFRGKIGIGSGMTAPGVELDVNGTGTFSTQINVGATSGTSYFKLVGGDSFVVQDDTSRNIFTVRDTSTDASGLTWSDAVSTFQAKCGDTISAVRNMVFSGSGTTGSVFDRLGISSLKTVIKDGAWTSFAAPTALLDLILQANAALPVLKVTQHASQSVNPVSHVSSTGTLLSRVDASGYFGGGLAALCYDDEVLSYEDDVLMEVA